MRTTTLLLSALLLGGCGQTAETTTTETTATAAKVITVTSKSPEAIAAFERARTLHENFRFAEATAAYDEALALDPDFALAHAWKSELMPGNDGLAEVRKAGTLSAGLPDAERKSIEAMIADREGDATKGAALWGEVATLAPDDWRVQVVLGRLAFDKQDWKAALDPLERATELAPEQGIPWNLLGYTQAFLGDTDAAVVSFDQYAKVAPTEPNPYDSKGEILMMAGRLEEAEAAFAKSTEVLPSFYIGHEGVGDARSLRGDFEGGRAAFEQAIATATRPQDKVGARVHLAWAWFAAGDPAKAEAVLAEAETEAKAAGLETAWMSTDRGGMAILAMKWDEAIAQSTEAMTRAEASKLEGGALIGLRLEANLQSAIGLAMTGKGADAEARVAAIEADAANLPGAESAPLIAKAAIAMGNKDAAGAIALLSRCPARDAGCAMMLVHANEMSGDAAAAEAARGKLLALNERGGEYLAIWALSGGPKALGAAAAADE